MITPECSDQKSKDPSEKDYCTHEERWIDKFDRLDKDKNGLISFTEYHNEDACFIQNLAHWFCGIDLDRNQHLGADEMRKAFLEAIPAVKYFKLFDFNKDLRLSYYEVYEYLLSEKISTVNLVSSFMSYSDTIGLKKFISLYNAIPNPTFPVICSDFPCLQLTQSQLQLFQSTDKNKDNWISFDELTFNEESEVRMRKEFDFLGDNNRFEDFYVEKMEEEQKSKRRWWDFFGWFSNDDEEKVQKSPTVYYVTRDQWMSMGTNGEVFYTVLYQTTFDLFDSNLDSVIDGSEFKEYLKFRNVERRNAWKYIRRHGKLGLTDFVTLSKRIPNIQFRQEEINSRMMKFHDEFQAAWKKGDTKKLASMYHPNGILVAAGLWVARGPEEIEERFKEWLQDPKEVRFNFTVKQASENGEYLFQQGTFEPADGSGIIGKFESIFKQQPDGSYLVYHDEFSF